MTVVQPAQIPRIQHRVAPVLRPVDPIGGGGVTDAGDPAAVEPGVPHLVDTAIGDDAASSDAALSQSWVGVRTG